MKNNKYYSSCISSPIGDIFGVASQEGLCFLNFLDSKRNIKELKDFVNKIKLEILDKKNSILIDLERELEEYFQGIRKEFTTNLIIQGSDFQTKVLNRLLLIPYGETINYKKISQDIGIEKSYRAVGNANSKNRISILIPCHRVISSTGDIGGYSGGEYRKRFLLDLERKNK